MIVAFVPRQRSLTQVCALAGAITIAVQLPAVHWFYYFIVWFMPFVLVALLAQGDEEGGFSPEADAVAEALSPVAVDQTEPALNAV
jgi:hypothetical protein